jgi:hypothetical protein
MISLEKEGYSDDAQKAIKDEYPDLIVVEESSYKIPQKSCLL